MVRPDDGWFPGLEKLRQEFFSHEWIFGKTPKFKVSKSYQIPFKIDKLLTFELTVVNGTIQDVRIQMPPEFLDADQIDLSEVLLKMSFDDKTVPKFAEILATKYGKSIPEVKRFFLVQSLDDMIGSFV